MKETGPGHFGAIDKNLTPSQEIKKDESLEISQQLNTLKKELEGLLQKGPEKGNEAEFEDKLTDLDNMIKQLENKV